MTKEEKSREIEDEWINFALVAVGMIADIAGLKNAIQAHDEKALDRHAKSLKSFSQEIEQISLTILDLFTEE